MASFAEDPASAMACSAMTATCPPSVTTPSIDLSCWSLDLMVAWAAGRLLLSTCRLVVVPPSAACTAAQRCSSATLPASWITQITFFTPDALSWLPIAVPATDSSDPKWLSAPNSLEREPPELMVMTGMPADTARWMDAFNASGLAIDTTRPSTFSLTAASISCACFCGSPSLW